MSSPEAEPVDRGESGTLRGLTAVVTGGNGGIGLGLAEGLLRAGASVAVWGRNAAKNAAAATLLAQLGDVIAVACDVTDEADVAAAMATTIERFGQVDSMFANAGIPGTSDRFSQAVVGRTPVRRWGDAADMAAAAVFLARPDLPFHTGDVLTVDGGYTIS